METVEIGGRYTVGVELYFSSPSCEEHVLRGARRAMSPEQIATLTRVRVISVRAAPTAWQAIVDASDGSVGSGETSLCEVLA